MENENNSINWGIKQPTISKEDNDMVDVIKCPHCGYLMAGEEQLDVGYMSGNFDMDCDKCKKVFNVDFTSVFYFTTTKKSAGDGEWK
ncbi:hypothetical protein [Bacillus paralicheniformis]|uniref:hypothetical protein n=1 Tax=Bacillus paralicheniformis TaxID=1648923 RepID=UPI0034D2F8EA